MTDEEFGEGEFGDELEEELVTGEPELGEPELAEVETGAGFTIPCFFHTGAMVEVKVPYESTALDLRKLLSKQGRDTYGSTMLINGVAQTPDHEAETYLAPSDSVVFSGSVKGG